MNDIAKFVIQYIVIPLITTIVLIITFLFRHESKVLHKRIDKEEKEREKQIGKLNMEMKEKITESNNHMWKIFAILQEINEKLGDVKSKISVQDEQIHNLKDNMK